VVLLRCATEEDAFLAFDRFRSRVAAHHFPQVQRLTLSIGFTDVRPGDTPVAAVERADRAVYYAKNHGRDQVRGLEALIRQGGWPTTTSPATSSSSEPRRPAQPAGLLRSFTTA
jgi:hypothetical protein